MPDLDAHVRCLAGFADALRLRPAVLVGRALGGAVAVAFAAAHPERVRALVLVATPARFVIPQERSTPGATSPWGAPRSRSR
ncbi:MAG: alpha/beta fold hydrolase [Candidatus Binatia bacterium]